MKDSRDIDIQLSPIFVIRHRLLNVRQSVARGCWML